MYILKRFEKLAFHREIVNQTFDDLEYDFQLRNIRMFCLHDNEAVVIELNHDGLSLHLLKMARSSSTCLSLLSAISFLQLI